MKIIQLSDTHLFADDEHDMFGVECNLKFKEVLDRILAEDIHDADFIFLTGDLSQDETAESYQKLVDALSPLNVPVYWLPGNHDNLLQLEFVFQQAKNFHRQTSLSLQNWHFVFLNTKVEGSGEGELSAEELKRLKHAISTDKKTAIVMHHHPLPVNTPCIDKYILRNREDFWQIVTGTKVALIMCGHVHHDYHFKHNNIMIESAPASCLQLEKGAIDLTIEEKSGYKIYHFTEEGYTASAKVW